MKSKNFTTVDFLLLLFSVPVLLVSLFNTVILTTLTSTNLKDLFTTGSAFIYLYYLALVTIIISIRGLWLKKVWARYLIIFPIVFEIWWVVTVFYYPDIV